MLSDKFKNNLNSISLTWFQLFAVVTTACLAALMMPLTACDSQPATVAPTSTAIPTATPRPTATPPAGTAGTTQQPLKSAQKYGLTGPPFFELQIYLDAISRGASPENADKEVETWVWVAGDPGVRAISQFLIANGVSENSIRIDDGDFLYVVAHVPVSLLIPLSEHPHALNVGDRIPTQFEKEAPAGSAAPPAPAPSDAAQWHRADSWHQAGFKGKGVSIGIIDTNSSSFTTHQSASEPFLTRFA